MNLLPLPGWVLQGHTQKGHCRQEHLLHREPQLLSLAMWPRLSKSSITRDRNIRGTQPSAFPGPFLTPAVAREAGIQRPPLSGLGQTLPNLFVLCLLSQSSLACLRLMSLCVPGRCCTGGQGRPTSTLQLCYLAGAVSLMVVILHAGSGLLGTSRTSSYSPAIPKWLLEARAKAEQENRYESLHWPPLSPCQPVTGTGGQSDLTETGTDSHLPMHAISC